MMSYFFYKPFKIIQDFTVSRAIWMLTDSTAINQDNAGVRSCQYGSVIEFVIPSGYLSMTPHDSKHRAGIITKDIGNISSEKMWEMVFTKWCHFCRRFIGCCFTAKSLWPWITASTFNLHSKLQPSSVRYVSVTGTKCVDHSHGRHFWPVKHKCF